MNFPDEEEDDEDYDPDLETETECSQPSDEEMSFISEATSGMRSPRVLLTPVSIPKCHPPAQTERFQVEGKNKIDSDNYLLRTVMLVRDSNLQSLKFRILS